MSDAALIAPRPGLSQLFAALHGVPLADESAPIDAAADRAAECAAAYAKGLAEGARQAEAALAPVRARLVAAAEAIEAAASIDAAALRPLFTELTHRLCAAALLAELRLAPAALRPLVDAALAAAGSRAAQLRLHPDTLAGLDLPSMAIAVVADPELAADAVRIDGPEFALETTLADRLAALVAGL